MDPNFFYTIILLLCIDVCLFDCVIGAKKIVKSYENIHGDIFDCVNILDQPAFDHPLLKNHIIQLRPSRELSIPENAQCPSKGSNVGTERSNCPHGTRPILRSQKVNTEGGTKSHFANPMYLVYASVGTEKNESSSYSGVGAVFDVWHPRVDRPDEYSMARVSVVSGYNTEHHTSIEAGWMVSDVTTGRFMPTRLFIRWTTDNYRKTGCFNLECPGFVLTNPQIVIGGAVSTLSPLAILILKDPKSGNWWLYKDCEAVGYWPANIFEMLSKGGEQVFFGGEIVNRRRNGRHTKTEMGNGGYGDEGKGKAATASFLQVKQNIADSQLTDLREYKIYSNKPHCYNVVVPQPLSKKRGLLKFFRRRSQKAKAAGVSMSYGGRGYNPARLCN